MADLDERPDVPAWSGVLLLDDVPLYLRVAVAWSLVEHRERKRGFVYDADELSCAAGVPKSEALPIVASLRASGMIRDDGAAQPTVMATATRFMASRLHVVFKAGGKAPQAKPPADGDGEDGPDVP